MIRRIGLVSVLASIAGVALVAAPASAQETAAATCSPRTGAITAGTGGSERFAQTFSPSLSGRLTRAEIDITKGGTPGDYIVQVMDVDGITGMPNNAVLASTTVPDSMPSGDFILNAVFASPATVALGQSYALVITRPGSDTLRTGVRFGCPGSFFYSQAGTSNWLLDEPDEDFVFTAFVTPPVPAAPVPAALTGQRAAAKKKCRKKFPGKANATKRKKCIKKAKRLPV